LTDINYRCLETIVAAENNKPGEDKLIVTLEQFAHVINWFGPISREDKEIFLDTMKDIMKENWFHGDISADAATNLLRGYKEGSFLVKTSKSDPKFPFTISYVRKEESKKVETKEETTTKTLTHIRIDKTSECFEFKDPTKDEPVLKSQDLD